MLPHYRVSLGATNALNQRKRFNVVNSPQVSKERTLRVHLLVERFCIIFQKYFLYSNKPLLKYWKITRRMLSGSPVCYKDNAVV